MSAARQAVPTRADDIIRRAEDASKMRYGDQSLRSAFEVGHLRAEIRNLCAELDAYKPDQRADLHYINLTLDRGLPVLAGYTIDLDDISVDEVWCNGLEISEHLRPEVVDSLREQALALLAEMRKDACTEAQTEAREWAREAA